MRETVVAKPLVAQPSSTMIQDDKQFMNMALDACRRGIDAGQSPFGACIVHLGNVIACAHNRVRLNTDSTAHAEVQAIREACQKANTIHLEGATIYSTTEPCAMCFGAIHWARIMRVVYAATVEEAQSFGFNELPISNHTLKRLSASAIEIVPGVMSKDAIDLFRLWQERVGDAY